MSEWTNERMSEWTIDQNDAMHSFIHSGNINIYKNSERLSKIMLFIHSGNIYVNNNNARLITSLLSIHSGKLNNAKHISINMHTDHWTAAAPLLLCICIIICICSRSYKADPIMVISNSFLLIVLKYKLAWLATRSLRL